MNILTKEDRLRIAASAEKSFWSDPNLSWHDALIAQTEAAVLKKLTEQNMEPVAWMYEYSYDLNGDKQGNWPVEMHTQVSFSLTKPDGVASKLYNETQLRAAQQLAVAKYQQTAETVFYTQSQYEAAQHRAAVACAKVCKKVQRDSCGEKYDMMGKDLAEQSAKEKTMKAFLRDLCIQLGAIAALALVLFGVILAASKFASTSTFF